MSSENKKLIERLIELISKSIEIDFNLSVALFFSIVTAYLFLDYADNIFSNFLEALLFILGLSVILNILYISLKKSDIIISQIKKLINKIYKIRNFHKICDKCDNFKKIRFNKTKQIYEYFCEDHPEDAERVYLDCTVCKQKNAISISKSAFSKCKYCKTKFWTSEILNHINHKFCLYISHKFEKPHKYKMKNEFIQNVTFLVVFSLVMMMINFLIFSAKGNQLLAAIKASLLTI